MRKQIAYIKEEMPEKYRQLELADQVLDAAISYRRVKLLKREEMNKGLSFTPEGQEMLVRLMDDESRALWQLETLTDELLAVGYEPTKVERPFIIPIAHEGKIILCGTCQSAQATHITSVGEYCCQCFSGVYGPVSCEHLTARSKPQILASGTSEHDSWFVGAVPCEGSIKSPITGEWEQHVSLLSWACANHPSGSEVQVKKGKACYCGNREN